MKIGVLKFQTLGNTFSVIKALETFKNVSVKIIENEDDVKDLDKIVIPGVGSFFSAIDYLEKTKKIDAIKLSAKSKPILGICLGMQLLCKSSNEVYLKNGFSFFDIDIKKLPNFLTVPVVGFQKVQSSKKDSILLKNLKEREFYFMHSYYAPCFEDTKATIKINNFEYSAVLEKDNFFGVQFHIEKSRDAGLKVFKNFIDL